MARSFLNFCALLTASSTGSIALAQDAAPPATTNDVASGEVVVTAQKRQVTTDLYEGGRHEILNETNRDEVVENFWHWLRDVSIRAR